MVRKKNYPVDVSKYPDLKLENPEKYYKFGEELGRGKFSVVKEVEAKSGGAKYAAKIIKYDSDSFKFAIREYDLMKTKLKGMKGCVQMHDAFLVRKYLIIVMDLVSGKSLLDKVGSMHSLSEEDIAEFIRQLVEFLDEWHSKNVIHLDLRPTNIRFVSGRDLKILDYNSCRPIANKKAGEVVDVIGDTEFCAPEMLNFEPCMPGSDMWTIGVLCYILLSGLSPFYYEDKDGEADEDKIVLSVQTVNWKFDDGAFENITSEAKDFIKKCFVRIPENRLTTENALKHKWLSEEYKPNRQRSKLNCQDAIVETDGRLYSEEEEDYIEASCVFRTFDEEEYKSPEVSDDDED